MIQFQEKAWKNRWKDGQTLFHRTLPANAVGPKSGNFEHYQLNHRSFLEFC